MEPAGTRSIRTEQLEPRTAKQLLEIDVDGGTPREIGERLAPQAALHLATDDVPYAHQMNEVLTDEPALENVNAPWPFVSEVTGRMRTGYEEQWRAEGRPMHFFAYRPVAAREAAA